MLRILLLRRSYLPPNASIEWGDPQDPPETGLPTTSDNCDPNPIIDWTDTVIPNLEPCVPGVPRIVIERLFTATDECGNTGTAETLQIIEIFDTTGPEMICPPTTTVEWGDPQDPPDTGVPEVTDNCDPNPIISHSDVEVVTGGCLPAIIITRTFTAVDNCGNANSCTQVVNVEDTSPPEFTAPGDVDFEWVADFNTSPVPPNTPQDPSIDPSCLPVDQQYGPTNPFWFLDLPAGEDVVQSQATINMQLADGSTVTLNLNGPVLVERQASDDLEIINPGGCSANQNGQNDVIQTEIISMDLSGNSPGLGDVSLRVGQDVSDSNVPQSEGIHNRFCTK